MGCFTVRAIPFGLYIVFLIDLLYMYIFTYETNKADRHTGMMQNAIIYIWIDLYVSCFLDPQQIQQTKGKKKNKFG